MTWCPDMLVGLVTVLGNATLADAVSEIVAAHQADRGALMPILHALNDRFGYVDPEAVGLIARHLNLSRAEVHGVVSFYHDFRTDPPARHILRICRAEACQAVGAEELAETVSGRLGVGFGERTADGALTLEQVFCLGNCALGPSVQFDGELLGRMDENRLAAVLADRTGSDV